MTKNFVAVLCAFALLQMVTCKPSAPAPAPGTITKESEVELPGRERISKRSVKTSTLLNTPLDDNLEPISGSSVSELKALESNEDFEETIAFRPLPVFRKRSLHKRETVRSVDDIQETRKRLLRSLNNDNESEDEMKVAENGLVFLPLFFSENGFVQNQRSRRSAQDTIKTEILSNDAETDLEAAETIIFRPVFRSQSRPVRSVVQEENLQGDDNMIAAENGLIFRPLFRTKQRGPETA